MVVCGDEVLVVATRNVGATDDVVTIVDVVATDGVVVVAAVVVWVQRCWMRACTSPQSHFVSVMVKLRGNEPSWWYRQTTQDPHSTMGRLTVLWLRLGLQLRLLFGCSGAR